jgi:WD40 repeat protein
VALSADGRHAVSCSSDQTLKVWDLESGAELRTLEGHSDWVSSVALSADGCRVLSASADQTVKLWDMENGACLVTFTPDAPATSCAILGDLIIAGDAAGRVYFLRLTE